VVTSPAVNAILSTTARGVRDTMAKCLQTQAYELDASGASLTCSSLATALVAKHLTCLDANICKLTSAERRALVATLSNVTALGDLIGQAFTAAALSCSPDPVPSVLGVGITRTSVSSCASRTTTKRRNVELFGWPWWWPLVFKKPKVKSSGAVCIQSSRTTRGTNDVGGDLYFLAVSTSCTPKGSFATPSGLVLILFSSYSG
jgi:hypothetical protein